MSYYLSTLYCKAKVNVGLYTRTSYETLSVFLNLHMFIWVKDIQNNCHHTQAFLSTFMLTVQGGKLYSLRET